MRPAMSTTLDLAGAGCWLTARSDHADADYSAEYGEGRVTSGIARRGKLLFRQLEAHLAIALGIVLPVLAHLDEQEQVHRRSRICVELACATSIETCLDGLPALAEHDRLLALARDVDRLLDPHRAVLERSSTRSVSTVECVGQLVVQAVEDLLARDLGGEHAQRRVGDLVLRVEPGPGGTLAASMPCSRRRRRRRGRDHEDAVERQRC